MEIGHYVRTKDGQIFKWQNNMTTKEFASEVGYDGCYTYVYKDSIVNSSPSIIDLIQVGDYVNNKIVETLEKIDNKTVALGIYECFIYPDEIKSIVTKEQFKSMEYRIGENK